MKVNRTWGWYRTLLRTPIFAIKILKFDPYKKLSYQVHKCRSEWWLFLWCRGGCTVTHDQKKHTEKYSFDTWYVPRNEMHQLINWHKPTYILEIQWGNKVIESDIERK